MRLDYYEDYPLTDPREALAVAPAPSARDRGWLAAGVVVGGLIMLGALFTFGMAPQFPWLSQSERFSLFYVPVAFISILFLGWDERTYPLAAALFFGFLGFNMEASHYYFVLGNADAALALDMVLAIPLVVAGLMGPSASGTVPSRRLPMGLAWSLWLIPAAGILATALAISPVVSLASLFSRVLFPLLVAVGSYRRLRGIEDYKIVWFGFLLGMLAIAVFDFRKVIIGAGYTETRSFHPGQREVGASLSFCIPMLYLLGGALWLALARAEGRGLARGVLWLLFSALVVVLVWMGASRGPALGLGLLLLWWMPKVLGRIRNFTVLLLVVFGGIAAGVFILLSLSHTTHNVGLVFDRLIGVSSRGITHEPRWMLWMQAIDDLKYRPLLGMGINNWVVLHPQFESVHSTVVGIFYDMGLLGVAAFGLFFYSILKMSRASVARQLSPDDQLFFLGCRAGWISMMVVQAVDLTMTSGQFKNSIFAYTGFFFPLLVMLVYSRHSSPITAAAPGGLLEPPWPGDTVSHGA